MKRSFTTAIAAALLPAVGAIVLYAGGATMKITSPSFAAGQSIPVQFTCEGKNINPALTIENVPAGAKALALIVEDPDAPSGTFTHWVVYDIPVTNRIAENSAPGIFGLNSAGQPGYTGPCPPSGTHRYFFRLYALDTTLKLKAGSPRQDLEKAMKGHVLEEAQLMATYSKHVPAATH